MRSIAAKICYWKYLGGKKKHTIFPTSDTLALYPLISIQVFAKTPILFIHPFQETSVPRL